MLGGLNTYGYALQNPLKYSDLLGLDVTISINRTGSTSTSISGTINVTSNVTSQTFSGHKLENRNPPNSNLPVPVGTYGAFVRTDHSPDRVELIGVPNATNIQIHNGNTASDVVGCFAAGTTSTTDFVGNSKNAMNQINSIIQVDGTGNITITVSGSP